MKVTIDPAVLAQPDAYEQLDTLARLISTGQHVWDIPVGDLDAIERSPWLNSDTGRTGQQNRKTFERAATASITVGRARLVAPEGADPPARSHQLQVPIETTTELGPALAELKMPARVWVEDDESDRRFLDCLVRVYDRQELRRALERGWLDCAHGGGKGGIPKRVLRGITNGESPRRLAAFVDSDRLYPGHESATVRAVDKLRKDAPVVAVVVLNKRETENYLPLAALAVARQRAAFKAFRDRLSPDQQDHFDMKAGFAEKQSIDTRGRKKTSVRVNEAQTGLYADLPAGVRKSLVDGFGPSCGQLFDRLEVTREGLEARCRGRQADAESELLDLLLILEGLL